jgi:prephenate dehydrogenase
MNVLVVGAGAMGRWFADALADGSDEPVTVAFADADPDAAAAAVADVSVEARAVPLDTDERFAVVCIAVPLPAAADAIATQAQRAQHALLDVTGSAAEPVAAMADHAPDLERLSLHPLFAPENAPGNVAVVADTGGPVTDAVLDALRARGNHCVETTAAEHDRAMETIQARAHVAVLAFGLAAEDVPDEFGTPVSDAMFDLVEQVSGGEPRVYADIQAAFDGADDVADAARQLADADAETFVDLYEEVGDRR